MRLVFVFELFTPPRTFTHLDAFLWMVIDRIWQGGAFSEKEDYGQLVIRNKNFLPLISLLIRDAFIWIKGKKKKWHDAVGVFGFGI
jgi:hypothetical protein